MNVRLQWAMRWLPSECVVDDLGVCRILAVYTDGQLRVVDPDGRIWLVAADGYSWPLWEDGDDAPHHFSEGQ